MELILASNSPRRKDLLLKAGFKFTVVVSNYEEKPFCSDPVQTAKKFAEGKALDVYNSLENKEDKVVLGADTIVYYREKILGKPLNADHAREMLTMLSDDVHKVVTGYSIVCAEGVFTWQAVTEVIFNKLTDNVIDGYIASGLYKDKAGSYGIQDGFPFVKEYHGSLNNVIGLPIEDLTPLIKNFLDK